MSSSGAPCGACKFLRRKCVSECIFAPYFDAEQGAAHFAAVHKIFGASNVSKLLQMIHPSKRCEAVLTICYEAQARLKDPVYGCVAHIFALQQQVVNLQAELAFVQAQLANRLAASSALNESCISSATTGYGCSPYDHTVRMKEEGSYMLMDGDCYRTLQHQHQHQNNIQQPDHHSASSSSDLQALAHELLLRNTPSSSSNLGPPPPLSTSSP